MRVESPLILNAAGRVSFMLLWSLFRTTRVQLITGSVNPYDSAGEDRYLFCIWHDSAVMAAFTGKHRRTVALTSRHRDGSFVAYVIKHVGVGAVRGSSGKTGGRAALELICTAKDKDIVITPDGPRGPRRELSPGIIYLASRTGNAIVPTTFACSCAWEIRGSWTTLTVPKPFSRVVALAGEPIYVPPNISDSGLAKFTNMVQTAMGDLESQAKNLMVERRETSRALASVSVKELHDAA